MSIKRAQLQMLGEVLANPEKHELKKIAFHRDSLTPETAAYIRRRGHPRHNWTEQLMSTLFKATGGHDGLTEAAKNLEVMRGMIKNHSFSNN